MLFFRHRRRLLLISTSHTHTFYLRCLLFWHSDYHIFSITCCSIPNPYRLLLLLLLLLLLQRLRPRLCWFSNHFEYFLFRFIFRFRGSALKFNVYIRFRLTIPFGYGVAQQIHLHFLSHFILFHFILVYLFFLLLLPLPPRSSPSSISIFTLYFCLIHSFYCSRLNDVAYWAVCELMSAWARARMHTFTTFSANNSFENNKISILFAIGSRPTRNLLPVNELRQTVYL